MRPLIAVLYGLAQVGLARLLAPQNLVRAFGGNYGRTQPHFFWSARRLQVYFHARILLLPISSVDFQTGPLVPFGRQMLILLAGPMLLLALIGGAVALLLTQGDWGIMRFIAAIFIALSVLHLIRALVTTMDPQIWAGYGLVMGDGERLRLLLRHRGQAPQVQRVLWHWVKDDYRKVLAELRPLLQTGEHHPELFEYAIYALLSQQDFVRAIAVHQDFADRGPVQPTDLVILSYLQALAGDADAALATVDAVLRRAPGFHLALNQRAWLRLKRGNAAAALRDLDRAIRSDPEFSAAYSNRAWAHFLTDQAGPAGEDLKKALELDPLNPLPHQLAAQIYAQAGDWAAAEHFSANAQLLGAPASFSPTASPP
ncbi:MAG: tetratricopeptide repeat protein [Bacteroidota bacterium]